MGPPRNRRPPARAARPLRGQEAGELVQETGKLVQETEESAQKTEERARKTGAEDSVPEKSNIKAENRSKGTAKFNILGMPISLQRN